MQAIAYPTTKEAMYEHLKDRLEGVVPDFELQAKAGIAVEINELKKKKNAIILGHNYMEPCLFHSVPDYTGDSLGLCRVAAEADADIIIFCGVKFMAETAKILNPQKKVLLPSAKGGCSLAAGITAEDIRKLKALYPNVPVVTYVNSYADAKGETDYCCTSGNAEAVVQHLLDKGHKEIIFLPDNYLGANVAKNLGMAYTLPQRTADGLVKGSIEGDGELLMIGWDAKCEVHDRFTVDDITSARKQFPDVTVLAHPECSPEVVAASDYAGSTNQMIKYVENMERGKYLLLTECSMGDNIAAKNPNREMVRLCSIRCPHMNEISLEETLEALKLERYEVDLPADIRKKAEASIERMIAIG